MQGEEGVVQVPFMEFNQLVGQVQQLQNQLANQPERPPRQPPIPTIKFYDNGDDWAAFRRAFNDLCTFSNYNDDTAKVALSFCMRDSANKVTEDMDRGDYNNIEDMLNAYEERFRPQASSSLAQTQYENAAQQPRIESHREWHGRLRHLYARAYPNGAQDDPGLIRHYCMGLCKANVRMQVLRGRPQTYASALEMAQNEQSVQDAQDPKVGTDTGLIRKTTKDKSEPMEIGAMTAGCFNCGQLGHGYRECPKAKTNPRPRGKGKVNFSRTSGRGTNRQKFNRLSHLKNASHGLGAKIRQLEEELEELEVEDDVFDDEDEGEIEALLLEAATQEESHATTNPTDEEEQTPSLDKKGDFP